MGLKKSRSLGLQVYTSILSSRQTPWSFGVFFEIQILLDRFFSVFLPLQERERERERLEQEKEKEREREQVPNGIHKVGPNQL